MTAKLSPDTTHRHCRRCDQTKPLTDFAISKTNALGRMYMCRACKRAYNTVYVRQMRQERKAMPVAKKMPPLHTAVPLPAMDLMERLECRRLARWAKNVGANPKFGVGFGGWYV